MSVRATYKSVLNVIETLTQASASSDKDIVHDA